ncbi:MAG: hypothetical protein DMG79_01590 [Acidobacteria bacterium]|nr:MAG: hypothetical protein DMG79_01590 [Acidobacteriota bacterium]
MEFHVLITFRKAASGRNKIALCGLVLLAFLSPIQMAAQSSDAEKPVPILTGNAGSFSFVSGGQSVIDTQINPVLLVPLGDHWLIESRAEFEGKFQRPLGGGPYGGPVDKHVDYAQIDYIANSYLTITAGRFLTPFGIFNERLYPIWIRALQPDPLILPINTAPSDGAMFRGGFPVSGKVNLNYAAYVSATSIGIGSVDSERHAGGRMGFFFPGPRLEVGGSWQKTLQDNRKNAFGFHMGWQPAKAPLNLRAEFARSYVGSGYWIEGAYRLSQAHFWQKPMRHTEVVARMQQFYSGEIGPDAAEALDLPSANTREADFGVNYFLHDGLKGTASYGRQFSSAGNFNQWSFGIAYRFLIPLGRVRPQS